MTVHANAHVSSKPYSEDALFEAILKGDSVEVDELLGACASNEEKNRAFRYALSKSTPAVIDLFVERETHLLDLNHGSNSPGVSEAERSERLMSAASDGNVEVVAHLMDEYDHQFLDVSAKKDAIYFAVRYGHVSMVQYLSSRGIRPAINLSDVIRSASNSGKTEMIDALIELGVNFGFNDLFLMPIVRYGDLKILEHLASLDFFNASKGMAPFKVLYAATEQNDEFVFEFVVAHMTFSESALNNAVAKAIQHDHLNRIPVLLEKGGSLIQDRSLLTVAISAQNTSAVDWLLQQGVVDDHKIHPTTRRTILDKAVAGALSVGMLVSARKLIKRGGSFNTEKQAILRGLLIHETRRPSGQKRHESAAALRYLLADYDDKEDFHQILNNIESVAGIALEDNPLSALLELKKATLDRKLTKKESLIKGT